MRQLKLRSIQPVQVWSVERLATTTEGNSAYREVTNCMKPGGTRYRLTTQVNRLSSEITSVSVADAVHKAEGRSLVADRRGYKNLTESEAVTWYQKDRLGTWETQDVLRREGGVCIGGNPINGKAVQKTFWESDQFVVSMKPVICNSTNVTIRGILKLYKQLPKDIRDRLGITEEMIKRSQVVNEEGRFDYEAIRNI